ncbi:hypothetical protein E2C01_080715 [Portunus trituberculatus]|uniref:Uncharacterized protein n=1 Tax=Portunus trituberculatus TaxID=210409 RepID=A0A5B7IQ34_PORTR|nr:hypothetical protein [Portunus trituberculatus]
MTLRYCQTRDGRCRESRTHLFLHREAPEREAPGVASCPRTTSNTRGTAAAVWRRTPATQKHLL